MNTSQPHQLGFAALVAVIIISLVVLTIVIGAGVVGLTNQRITRNVAQSAQSYYLAEAGMEDSLLRIIDPDMTYDGNNTLTIGSNTATITTGQTGQSINITSEGNVNNRIRTVSTSLQKNTTGASFFYGIQVGEGGFEISHLEGQVVGNVYSNGTSHGSGSVTGSVIIGGDGNQLQDLTVGENLYTFTCADATVAGDIIYNDAGSSNCTVGGSTSQQADSFPQIEFPISDEQIDDWKTEAALGGTLTGNQVIGSDQTLGPVKIDGNLFIENNVRVTMTGNVWVTGSFDTGNNAIIELIDSYGSDSGVFIADGNIQLQNNVVIQGTDDPNSFIMVISTSSSESEASAAIDVKNNLDGAILFTPNGIMVVHNNVALVEAIAHKLLIQKASITYESGLANLSFSSGPTGGWDINAWVEIY